MQLDRKGREQKCAGGRVFVASGIVVILAGLLTGQWANIVMTIVVVLCTMSVLVYSYIEWKREMPSQTSATKLPS